MILWPTIDDLRMKKWSEATKTLSPEKLMPPGCCNHRVPPGNPDAGTDGKPPGVVAQLFVSVWGGRTYSNEVLNRGVAADPTSEREFEHKVSIFGRALSLLACQEGLGSEVNKNFQDIFGSFRYRGFRECGRECCSSIGDCFFGFKVWPMIDNIGSLIANISWPRQIVQIYNRVLAACTDFFFVFFQWQQ